MCRLVVLSDSGMLIMLVSEGVLLLLDILV